MKHSIQSETDTDPQPVEANDWGSDLDEFQIRKRQLAEIANEILYFLRKMPEAPDVQQDGVVAALE